MSSLLKSLRKSTTEKFIKSTKSHVRKAAECVMALKSAFKKIKNGGFDEAKKKLVALDELENQADVIRRSILLELTSSELQNRVREAFAHLVKNVDRIANTANGAGRIFSQLPDKYFSLIMHDEEFIMKMLDKSIEATNLLVKMLDGLSKASRKDIDGLNHKIQVLEHDVDNLMASLYEKLLNREEDVPSFVAIQVSKGINYIEAISDSVEDTADYIKVLTINA
ncbi:MAG: DUF47 domain-containing protein [Promethearchaeota archaeon]